MTTVDKCQSVLITAVVVGEMEKAVGGKVRVEGGEPVLCGFVWGNSLVGG